MRIVIAGQGYYPALNGQVVFTVHLAEGLAQAGHDVLALVPATREHPRPYELNNVRVHPLPAIHLGWLHEDIYYSFLPSRETGRALDAFKPDVVNIQDHYAVSAEAVAWARAHGVPLLGTNHFLPDNLIQNIKSLRRLQPLSTWLLWEWMLGLYRSMQVIVTPSETAARILRAQRIRVPILAISCGVDTDRFSPQPRADRAVMRDRYGLDPVGPLFLYVGRLETEKRLDVLLRAMKEVPGAQLAIAGGGRDRLKLEELAQALGLQSRVVFLGRVSSDDLPGLYSSADLFVMPSIAELLSIATLEAMACGKPVVAAAARALPELVTEGVNGSLFRPDDSGDAAYRMRGLLDHREDWDCMGQASRARAMCHSLSRTIQSYEQAFTTFSLVRRPRRSLPLPPIGRRWTARR